MFSGFVKPAHAFWVALACVILLLVLMFLPESTDADHGLDVQTAQTANLPGARRSDFSRAS